MRKQASSDRRAGKPVGAMGLIVLRVAGFALGMVILLLSLATDRIGLTAGPRGQAMTVMMILGLFLVASAIAGRSFRRWYRAASLALLGAVVGFALLELIAALLLRPGLGSAAEEAGNGASLLPAPGDYMECPWAPFTVWTDPAGGRPGGETFLATRFEGGDTLDIFLYGGSDVWSPGVNDSLRIRSLLRSGLESGLQRPVMVYDRSAPYFTSTQALLSLLISLRDGERPGFVLILVGSDEVLSALESGASGLHRGMAEIARRMDDTTGTSKARFTLALLARDAASSSVFRLGAEAFTASSTRLPAPPFPPVEDPGTSFAIPETLATAMIRNLDGTCAVLDALSSSYGFGYAVVLLPSYASPPNPGAASETQRKAWPDSSFFMLQSYVRGELSRWAVSPHLISIGMSVGDSNWVMAGRSLMCKPGQNRAVAEALAGALLTRPEWLSN